MCGRLLLRGEAGKGALKVGLRAALEVMQGFAGNKSNDEDDLTAPRVANADIGDRRLERVQAAGEPLDDALEGIDLVGTGLVVDDVNDLPGAEAADVAGALGRAGAGVRGVDDG